MPPPKPPVRRFKEEDWHRLIPASYAGAPDFAAGFSRKERELVDILAGATDDSVQAQNRGLSGISLHELVFGVPHAGIINNAFCWPAKDGSRFNDSTRGAWYAARDRKTAIEEVAYHKAQRLASIVVPGLPGGRPHLEVFQYDDWLASFDMDVHWLDPPDDYQSLMAPEPVPECYRESQAFAVTLLKEGSNGICYLSVRDKGSPCVACFRPALIYAPQTACRIEIAIASVAKGYSVTTTEVPI